MNDATKAKCERAGLLGERFAELVLDYEASGGDRADTAGLLIGFAIGAASKRGMKREQFLELADMLWVAFHASPTGEVWQA